MYFLSSLPLSLREFTMTVKGCQLLMRSCPPYFGNIQVQINLSYHEIPCQLAEKPEILIFISQLCSGSVDVNQPQQFFNGGLFKPMLSFSVYKHLNILKIKLLRFSTASGIQSRKLRRKTPTSYSIKKTHLMKRIQFGRHIKQLSWLPDTH